MMRIVLTLLIGTLACGSESDDPLPGSSGGSSSGGSSTGGSPSTGGGGASGGSAGSSGAAGASGAGGSPAAAPIWTQHQFADSFGPTLEKYGAIESCLVRQSAIDEDSDGIFDGVAGTFTKRVEECPDDVEVPLVFDWEGDFLTALAGKDGVVAQQAAIPEAIKVLEAGKALRPKALVGFYNIPMNGGSYKTPLNPPAWWMDQVTSLAPLYAVSDALYPSMYQPYQIGDDGQISLEDDQAVEGNYAKLALTAANGKPVYPYVWELYHNAALPIDLTPIPTQELYWHVEGAMNANVNGAKIAGLVWWGMAAGPDGTEPALKAFRQALDGTPYQP